MSATASVRCITCRALAYNFAPRRLRLPPTAAPQSPLVRPSALNIVRNFASSKPPTRPVDARVDINLTVNRPPIDALCAAYVQSPSPVTLKPLLSTLTIHQHLYQLSTHLRTKLAATSATARLFFSPNNSTPADGTKSTPAISFTAVNVQQLDDELLSERIVKSFNIQPHTPPTPTPTTDTATPAASPSLPIIVESDWRTERNKVRGMGVESYSMRVLVHVPLPLTAGFPSSLASAASVMLSDEYASFVLTDSYDTGVVMRDAELVGVLPVLMGMGELTEKEWVWLMSELCVHPSDVAFDVLSAALGRGDR